jgi:hypothetical protein
MVSGFGGFGGFGAAPVPSTLVLLVGDSAPRLEGELFSRGIAFQTMPNATETVARLKTSTSAIVIVAGNTAEMLASGVAEGVIRHFEYPQVLYWGDLDPMMMVSLMPSGRLTVFPSGAPSIQLVEHVQQRTRPSAPADSPQFAGAASGKEFQAAFATAIGDAFPSSLSSAATFPSGPPQSASSFGLPSLPPFSAIGAGSMGAAIAFPSTAT